MENCKKPDILVFVAHYLPGYKSGGPVRTIANMVDRLGDEFNFRIITSDRDSFDTHHYSGIEINNWNIVGNARVFYLSPEKRSFKYFAQLIRDTPHDILYLNSFFNTDFSIKPMILRRIGMIPKKPTIIAPRGEFSFSALKLKWLKKYIYIKIVKSSGVFDNVTWQASSEYEENDIRNIIGSSKGRIYVAPNIPPKNINDVTIVSHEKRLRDHLKICFISRITPMKNLDYALRVLEKVTIPIEFNIYGLVDENELYWPECTRIISSLPKNVVAKYYGPINHSEVVPVMECHDIFFLPSRGENYCHAILEAFSAGLPVLTSDLTPWRNLEELGVGWDIPLSNIDKFRQIIFYQYEISKEEYASQKIRARNYYNTVSNDNATLEKNSLLFNSVN